jgi:hypothetical protein
LYQKINSVAYEHGAIQGVKRTLLDPRRPTGKPSSNDQAEGLIPYGPIIYDPKEILSYYKPVLGVETIKAVPTELESTTIILCFGLDIFITKRKPSGGFDTLNDSFSYVQLLGTMIALLIGSVVVKRLADRKELVDAWK